SLEAPTAAHRRLFQGLGQPPTDAEIPPANCSRPGPFSFYVSLKDDNGEHSCGGILVSDGVNSLSRWVVTSAHCIDDLANPNAVFLPEVDIAGRRRDEPIETLTTVESVLHPDWSGDRSEGNDIAVLKLSNTSCYRFPVPLAEEDFTISVNGTAQFVSFGREVADGGFSAQLQAGSWDVIGREDCEEEYIEDDTELTDSMMCSRGMNVVGMCQGDEGSPLVWFPNFDSPGGKDPFAKRILGIASFSDVEDCQSPDGVAIFTSVAKMNKWINETIFDLFE
ncbi:unnamed protein product, partial [Ostreobium quekettii]